MLQAIREKFQGWIIWAIVIVICITFALWGINSFLYSNQAKRVIVTVNGTKITQQDFSNTYDQLKRQQQLKSNHAFSQQSQKLLKNITLQSMISSLVLTQNANKSGFKVGTEFIEITIAKMPIFQINGIFSPTRFTQILRNMLISPEAFSNELRNNILLNQLRSGIIDTAFVLPQELDQSIKLIQQKRKFNYMVIPVNHFIAQIQIPNQMITDYYQTHQKEFEIPEQVSIEYLSLSITDLLTQIHPTQKELKTFYQNNIAAYTQPKKWNFTTIITTNDQNKIELTQNENIKNKTELQFILKTHHLNIQSEQTVWKSSIEIDAALQNILNNLKVGEISPIQTKQGYTFIQLLDTKSERVLPFQEVKDQVLKTYQHKKAEEKFAALNDQFINMTYEHPQSLEPAAKQLGLTIQKTPFFTKEGTKKSITQHQNVITSAFSDEVLEQHINSEPINIDNNTVIVLRMLQHKSATIKPLKQVETQIARQLKQKTAQQKAEELGNQILKNLLDGKNISNIMKKHQLKWININYVPRYSKHADLAILNTVFHLPKPINNKPTNTGITLPSGDFAVISLTHIQENRIDKKGDLYQTFNQQIENSFGLSDYQTYVDGLMKRAKIVMKQKDFLANNEE